MKRLIVAITVAALLLLGAGAAGFALTVHQNNDAVHNTDTAVQQAREALLLNRAHADVTRRLICEIVRRFDLPAEGC